MVRYIVCVIGIFVFGVIYGEILNALHIFDFNVNVYLFAGSISFTYFFMDLTFRYFEKKSLESNESKDKFKKIQEYYYLFLAFLGFILVVAVPFIWWGAIKQLAVMANKGIS